MYIVTGATGNTGNVVARKLLSQGKKVRVVGRNAESLRSLTTLGAEAFVGDLTDQETATRAFEGGQAAYVVVPPNLTSPNYTEYQNKVIAAVSTAIEKSATRHIVALSSIGADKRDKTGPIAGLHRLEDRLKQISGLNAIYLRAAYFMENTLGQAGVIRQMRAVAGPLRSDLRVPMIASQDIGNFAGDVLLNLTFQGHQTQELLGQRDLSYAEVTVIMGAAIGEPDLQYRQITMEQFHAALVQMGMSSNTAGLVVEMSEALNSGHVRALEPRTPANTTLTSYEQFVAEKFLPAYRANSAMA